MNKLTRRAFTKYVGVGLTIVPVAALVTSLPSRADTAMVDPESANAKALQYTTSSTTEGSSCSGCQLYTGEDGAESGPCSVFGGNSVTSSGWCTAFVPSAS